MRKYTPLSLILFFLSFLASAHAGETGEILSKLVDGVERFTLSNGMKVLFYKREHAPVFSGQLWVKVGGVNEVPGATGASHMLEHMAFKGSTTVGTKNYPKEKKLMEEFDEVRAWLKKHKSPSKSVSAEEIEKKKERIVEISKELESLWKSNEFSRLYQDQGAVGLNAATGKDYTFYMVSLPNTAFELWASMESDRLLNPVFRQFYKEVQVVLEERRWRTDDSPSGKLYEALLATAFWMHPNRLPVIGWPSDLHSLERSDIEEIFKDYYRPDNMVISLVGDLESSEVRGTLEKYFSRLPKIEGEVPSVDTVEEPQEGLREAVVKFDAKPQFAIAYHKPVYPNPDDMRFTLMHSVLSEGRTSIFYKEMVEGRQMVTSLDTSEAPGELFPSLFYVWGTPKKGIGNKKVIAEVDSIFERLKKEPVDASILESSKKKLRVSLLNSLSSNSGLARMLGKVELIYGDWQALIKMYDVTFETSPKDLQDLAKKYFTEDNKTIIRLESKTKEEAQ